jgi:hypothetical protein
MILARHQPSSRLPNEESCPVPMELLALLLRADKESVRELAAILPDRQRARLAFFCYGRAHLQAVGTVVAGLCELPALLDAASSQAAGLALYAQSRPVVQAGMP